jgi:hypothetical protein
VDLRLFGPKAGIHFAWIIEEICRLVTVSSSSQFQTSSGGDDQGGRVEREQGGDVSNWFGWVEPVTSQ